jgi:CheY-like chemotaxis protein
MQSHPLQLLLADDDDDDCFLFEEALSEIPVPTQLTTVHDGEQLMQLLTKTTDDLPHVLFLDLNMPRKNGFQCLNEIKQNEKLKNLAVVIFSTSCQDAVADQLYISGAQHYICKPNNFAQLKKLIHQVLTLPVGKAANSYPPTKENFVLA